MESLVTSVNFKYPLKFYPQLNNDQLYLPYINYTKEITSGQFGVALYNIESNEVQYHTAPFVLQDKYVTVGYVRLVAHGFVGNRLILSFGWQENYDLKYKMLSFQDEMWHEAKGLKKEADEGLITINEDVVWEPLLNNTELDLKKTALDGGEIFCWKKSDHLVFAADVTHAFESDNSVSVDSNPTLDKKLEKIVIQKSNIKFKPLIRFLDARKLPECIQKEHPIRDRMNIHSYWVAIEEKELFFFNNDYAENGITEMLHVKRS